MYDVAIIGSGPAGISAAINLKILNKSVIWYSGRADSKKVELSHLIRNYPAFPEISGKKLGVIGLGAIGVLVANAATHLGMEVLGYDPYISVNAAWSLSRSVRHISSVEDKIGRAHV